MDKATLVLIFSIPNNDELELERTSTFAVSQPTAVSWRQAIVCSSGEAKGHRQMRAVGAKQRRLTPA
jgi:hypothetical protein